jgi:hypothetical protein
VITIRFGCGHVASLEDSVTGHPSCAICGNDQVARVSTSRPPHFKGARGPYGDGDTLEAVAVPDAAPKGPLLRETTHG